MHKTKLIFCTRSIEVNCHRIKSEHGIHKRTFFCNSKIEQLHRFLSFTNDVHACLIAYHISLSQHICNTIKEKHKHFITN